MEEVSSREREMQMLIVGGIDKGVFREAGNAASVARVGCEYWSSWMRENSILTTQRKHPPQRSTPNIPVSVSSRICLRGQT